MNPPKPDDRRRRFGRSHPSADETLVDYGPAGAPVSVPRSAGQSIVQVSVATDVGRVRRNNEDYVQAEQIVHDGRRYAVWAVADGVGGGPQGERASRTAIETVVDYLTHEEWTDPSAALTAAFALANRNVFEITGEGAAASTLVVALVSEPEAVVTIANVGDSRAYIVAGGEARPITDDHSIVAARVAAGQITAAEARTAADRNVLTRSIGSESDVLVDVFGPRQLQPNERLVLCTDGVHGMIDDGTIGRITGSVPLGQCAGALVAASVEAGGRDNATALVGGYGQASTRVQAVAVPTSRAHDRPPRVAIFAALGLVLVVAAAGLGLIISGSPSPSGTVVPSIGAAPSAQAATFASNPVAPTGSSSATASPSANSAATSTFSQTGPMMTGRSSHTATRLSDGRVLIAGGYGGSYVNSAELYDPATGKFSQTGPMMTGRSSHTATLLSDGRVLIAGGCSDGGICKSALTLAELYDPAAGTFSPTGPMGKARSSHTATLLSDGRVLIAGGYGGGNNYSASAELYTP
jgi:serine/threonine protein phosphatase PrpC